MDFLRGRVRERGKRRIQRRRSWRWKLEGEQRALATKNGVAIKEEKSHEKVLG